MKASEQLRALVKEATPGPWRCMPDSDWYIVFSPNGPKHAAAWTELLEDTCLIALAPQLAELVADMAEAIDETVTVEWMDKATDEQNSELKRRADRLRAARARLDALFPEEAIT